MLGRLPAWDPVSASDQCAHRGVLGAVLFFRLPCRDGDFSLVMLSPPCVARGLLSAVCARGKDLEGGAKELGSWRLVIVGSFLTRVVFCFGEFDRVYHGEADGQGK